MKTCIYYDPDNLLIGVKSNIGIYLYRTCTGILIVSLMSNKEK